MAIIMKNGKKLYKNFFDYTNDSPATLKHKRSILAGLKLDTPLFSWPKDKVTLLSLINTYLARVQLYKLHNENGQEVEETLDSLLDAVGGVLKDIETKESEEDKEERKSLTEEAKKIDEENTESESLNEQDEIGRAHV